MNRARGKFGMGRAAGAALVLTLAGILPGGAMAEQGPTVLKGQQGAITWLAVSPDGKRLLACSSLEIKLWDVASRRVQWTAEGFLGGMMLDTGGYPVFSPDGKRVAMCSSPGDEMDFGPGGGAGSSVQVRDAATGQVVQRLPAGLDSQFVFSPDSKVLAIADTSGAVRLWDVTTGRARGVLQGNKRFCQGLVFSPDGKLLASPGSVMQIRPMPGGGFAQQGGAPNVVLWDVSTGKQQAVVASVGGTGENVAFSPDGKLLAVPSPMTSVVLYETAGGKLVRTLKNVGNDLLAFTPDGKHLVACVHRGASHLTVVLCDLETGQPRGTIAQQNRTMGVMEGGVTLSADTSLLAACDGINAVKVFETASGKRWAGFRTGPSSAIQSMALFPDGRHVAAGTVDELIYVWDVPDAPTEAEAAPAPVPAVSEHGPAPEEPQWRTWTTADGKHTVEAVLADDRRSTVVLKKKGGGEVEVRMTRLSEADRKFVLDLRKNRPKAPPSSPDVPLQPVQPPGQAPGQAPVTWHYNKMPFNGKLLVDTTGVNVLFEGIPMMGGGMAFGQITVAGPSSAGGEEGAFGGGGYRITFRSRYAEGVATIIVRHAHKEHKLGISNGGRELVVNGEHKFDLSGGKKSILVDARGKARESKKPIRVPAGPAWGPMRGPGPF